MPFFVICDVIIIYNEGPRFYENDLKGIWNYIKLAANIPIKSNTLPILDSELMDAANLNKHFCEFGPKLRDSTPVYTFIVIYHLKTF